MKLSKLYNLNDMNSYQFIALTGFVMTLLAHLILWLINKQVDSFEALYLCWGVAFLIGSIVNLNSSPEEDDHHHHHH